MSNFIKKKKTVPAGFNLPHHFFCFRYETFRGKLIEKLRGLTSPLKSARFRSCKVGRAGSFQPAHCCPIFHENSLSDYRSSSLSLTHTLSFSPPRAISFFAHEKDQVSTRKAGTIIREGGSCGTRRLALSPISGNA